MYVQYRTVSARAKMRKMMRKKTLSLRGRKKEKKSEESTHTKKKGEVDFENDNCESTCERFDLFFVFFLGGGFV